MIGLPLSVFKFLAYFASDIPVILALTTPSPFQSSTKVCESPAISVYVIFNEPATFPAVSANFDEYTWSTSYNSPTIL